MKISDLFEAPLDKKQHATKTAAAPDLSAFSRVKIEQPLARTGHSADVDDKKSTSKNLRTASQAKTLAATSNISMSRAASDLMSKIKTKDIPTEVGDPEPKPPGADVALRPADVPAVISRSLKAAGEQNPDFHLVSNLPGNMSAVIRKLGVVLFKSFTTTAVQNISMIGNLGGQGPNTTAEVNAVAGFLKKHGEDLGPGTIDFNAIMPGYEARIHNYEADGVHYMLVKDDFGNYIYTWPAGDSKGHGSTPKISSSSKKLK